MSPKPAFLCKLSLLLLSFLSSGFTDIAWAESGLAGEFRSNDDWSGADGAFSIDMGEKVLWIFGDTFIGTINGGTRDGNVMIHNSLALQDKNRNKMSFYWTRGKEPSSYFSDEGKAFFWPGDGIHYQNKVYLFGKRVELVPGKSEDPFGFSWKEDEIFAIDNPDDSPDFWQFRRSRIPGTDRDFHLGCACLKEGDYLYVLGMKERERKAFLARVRLSELSELRFSSLEFYCKKRQSKWSNKRQDATLLWDKAAAEGSLIKTRNGFLCIYHENGMGKDIVARNAKNLEGPWSEAQVIYKIPDSDLKRGFCYAGKAHVEQEPAQSDSLTITYAINPGNMAAHSKDVDAYFPKVVKVKIPESAPKQEIRGTNKP